jgi:hypothetical protein
VLAHAVEEDEVDGREDGERGELKGEAREKNLRVRV